jgi:hypothetical protein
VSVKFSNQNVPGFLPADISLSLFRVTQEARQNALKYSDVREFAVSLRGALGEIQLEIHDAGVGFDVEQAKRQKGLGLVSMQERVHLVHGTFAIESQAGSGTRIFIRVPFVAETLILEDDGKRLSICFRSGAMGRSVHKGRQDHLVLQLPRHHAGTTYHRQRWRPRKLNWWLFC